MAYARESSLARGKVDESSHGGPMVLAPDEVVPLASLAEPQQALSDAELADLREQIALLGPFGVKTMDDINAGSVYKLYKLARSSKGGVLGAHQRSHWVRYSDMTDDEKRRTKRFMYDRDEEMLASVLSDGFVGAGTFRFGSEDFGLETEPKKG